MKIDTKGLQGKELYDFLIENKDIFISQKRSEIKQSENFSHFVTNKTDIQKTAIKNDTGIIEVLAVVNTTNYMDRHGDVHLPGIWTKTISENKRILHLQEHLNSIESVISSGADLKVFVVKKTWIELGYNFDGFTEALIFDSIVREKRNELMYNQYANGWISQHSVGMQYVNIQLALNDPNSEKEYAEWQKNINNIANKEVAFENGFFWAVYEAKLFEGSAVLNGSNDITPTLEITEIEPSYDTQKNDKPTKSLIENYLKTLKN